MKRPKLFIALLRIALGWLLLYQGTVAFTQAGWSVAPLIENARTFTAFYAVLAKPGIIAAVTLIVKLAYVIIGGLLVLGIFAKIAAFLGIVLMLFLYFPLLHFPYVGTSYYIIDDHLIYALFLAYLFVSRSGEYFGVGNMFRFSRY